MYFRKESCELVLHIILTIDILLFIIFVTPLVIMSG